MSYTYLNDVSVRKQQYLNAIDFYLKRTTLPIVFCENTLFDFSPLYYSEISSGRFEYLTFDGNNFDRAKGKGYGEIGIMEYAYANSILLRDADIVIKITGRLIVQNIARLVKMNKLVIYPVIQTLFGNQKMMDSRIILAPSTFFKKYFFLQKEFINDSEQIYFEHALYNAVISQSQYFYFPLLIVPRFSGQSGTSGNYYKIDFSFYDQLIYMYHSLGNGIRFNQDHARKVFSIWVVGLIQTIRVFIRIIITVCSKMKK